MPNYVLSRTSPPAHIYERKVNLGYGVKVDTSDAPKPLGKKMENVKESTGVAEQPVNIVALAAFADGSTFVQEDRSKSDTTHEAYEGNPGPEDRSGWV